MKRYVTEIFVDSMEMLTRPQQKADGTQQPQPGAAQPEPGDSGMPF